MDILISDQNFTLKLDEENRLIVMRFIGDIEDEAYKKYWEDSFVHALRCQVNRVVVDQSEVGNVSFNARGWVAIKMFPKINKQLPSDLAGAIISSSRLTQRSGLQYLTKTFQALTNFRLEFCKDEQEAVEKLLSLDQKLKIRS
jgi:hypothetical protein